MGTKIEYFINPLSYSADCNNFTIGGVDAWDHYQNKGVKVINNHCNIGVNNLQDPMDKMLDKNNIDSIRKTMQMHEDIFKNQVKELHRVYSVQKRLMDDVKNEINQKSIWSPMNGTIGINHPYFVQQQQQIPTQISFSHVQILKEDLYIKERSGSCSGELIKRQKDFDLEKPAPSVCDEAFQNCKISNDGCDEEMEMDLTLCIGNSQTKKKKKSYLLPLGFSDSPNGRKNKEFNSYVTFQSDRVGDCSDPTTPMSSSSVTFDQDKKGPHWLSQGLKLK